MQNLSRSAITLRLASIASLLSAADEVAAWVKQLYGQHLTESTKVPQGHPVHQVLPVYSVDNKIHWSLLHHLAKSLGISSVAACAGG
jgi:hypothetical protein